MRDKRADMRDKLADTPDKRADTRDKRADTPDKLADTPDKRIDTPDKRTNTPDKRADMRDKRADTPDKRADTQESDLLTGRNAVFEALKSGRPLNKVFIQAPVDDSRLKAAELMAKNGAIPVIRVDKAWLDKKAGRSHQGIAASASAKEYCDIREILEYAAERAEKPLIVVTNKIFDANNLGAIIRSAEAAGAHGVIIPKRNAAGLTGAVARVSAGALEYMRVSRASNIADALRNLKELGVWVIGADAAGGVRYDRCDMTGGTAIVIGGENDGLGRLVAETCDYLVSLPMRGRITSLNASAAAAVLLYEAVRQRGAVS